MAVSPVKLATSQETAKDSDIKSKVSPTQSQATTAFQSPNQSMSCISPQPNSKQRNVLEHINENNEQAENAPTSSDARKQDTMGQPQEATQEQAQPFYKYSEIERHQLQQHLGSSKPGKSSQNDLDKSEPYLSDRVSRYDSQSQVQIREIQ